MPPFRTLSGPVRLFAVVRHFFDLDLPRLIMVLAATGIVAIAILALEATDRITRITPRVFRWPAAR